MAVIGELFDVKLAKELVYEMNRLGFEVEFIEVNTPKGQLIQILGRSEIHLDSARDYFRVRMGLPGAPAEVDPAWLEIKARPLGKITKGLIVTSVSLFLFSFKPEIFKQICELLFFNRPDTEEFSSLMNLEVWRLITPIFLHFGWMHIIFNCLWMKDLGSYWESEVGWRKFLIFTVTLAISSNLAQYIHAGPSFGGLSGVVYGLFGISWGYSLLGAKDSIALPKRDIMLMVGWYFLCLSGVIGNIANVAHGVGLGVGLFISLIDHCLLKDSSGLRSGFNNFKVMSLGVIFCVSSFLIEGLRANLFQ